MLRFYLVILTCLFLPPSAVFSAELLLNNGDRISGQFLRRADGRIYFRSPLLGDISVPESKAVVVEAPETPVESLSGLPPGGVAATPSDESSSTAVSTTRIPPAWRGKIEFGAQDTTGRTDSLSLTLRGDAEKKSGANSYRADARFLYGKQEESLSSDRYDATFRWRHELSERVFGQSQTKFTRDRVKRIDQNWEEGAGFGYRLVNRPRNAVNVGAGITLQYREADGIDSGLDYLGEIFQDYTYKLTGRVTLHQDANVLYSPLTQNRYTTVNGVILQTDQDAQNYRIRLNTALQGKISERLSFNVRFEYEYDNAILDPEAKVDRRITTTLGLGF